MVAHFTLRTNDENKVFFRKKSDLTTPSMKPNAFNKSKFLIYSMCAHNEQPVNIKKHARPVNKIFELLRIKEIPIVLKASPRFMGCRMLLVNMLLMLDGNSEHGATYEGK